MEFLNTDGVHALKWRRCLLREANLPKSFRVRALVTAFHLSNRVHISSIPDGMTPYELFHNKKPDLSHLRVFGCTAFTLN